MSVKVTWGKRNNKAETRKQTSKRIQIVRSSESAKGRLKDSERRVCACPGSLLREPEREHELADETGGVLALVQVGDADALSLVEVVHCARISTVSQPLEREKRQTHCSP